MFVDVVKLKLMAGKGGDGCTAFHREKYVDMGGPDGGNGGKGGDIIFRVEKGLRTLIDLKYQKIMKADKGANGKGSSRNGANAEDIIVKVPEGTTVYDEETNLIICDLINDKEEYIVAHGGRGGRGNRAFATHENNAPKYSELGEPGELRFIRCELKVLADVGFVGMPSVGKSTLLSKISNSNPKIGAYHFTTLSPNLGLVELEDKRRFVVADLPGLIVGASKGVGLGDQFLRHAMRTRVIAHILDMGSFEGRDPIQDYEEIREEIKNYSNELANKEEVIIANKCDLPAFEENLKRFKDKYPKKKIFSISAEEEIGIKELLNELVTIVENIPYKEIYDDSDYEKTIIYKFKQEKPYTITKENNVWVLSGHEVETLFHMTRFSEPEGVIRFGRKLHGMGIEDELERLGAVRGDEVQILDYIFIFKD